MVYIYVGIGMTGIDLQSTGNANGQLNLINDHEDSSHSDYRESAHCDVTNVAPPIDSFIIKYSGFDEWFDGISYNYKHTLEYIEKKSKSNCHVIDHGVMYEFQGEHSGNGYGEKKLNIALMTLFMPSRNISVISKGALMEEFGINIYNDIRTYYLKIANTLRYAEINGYSFIYLMDKMWQYEYDDNPYAEDKADSRRKYTEYMDKPHWQKPFFIDKYLDKYDWILWIDYDTIIANCVNEYGFTYSIEDMIIKHAQYLHQNKQTISLIFGGEYYSTINSGIFAIKNNEWSKQFLKNWMYLHSNVEKFQVLKVWNVLHDQTLFVALLQGFNVWQKITNKTYKDIEYKRDLSRRRYIEEILLLNLDELYENPIFDKNMAKYAVAIEQHFINGKLYNMVKGKYRPVYYALDINQAYILHFYSKDKTSADAIFPIFNHSLHYCALT